MKWQLCGWEADCLLLRTSAKKADISEMNPNAQPAALKAASMSQLPKLMPGWQPVRYTVLSDGTLAVLATDVDLAGEHHRITAAFQAAAQPDPPSRLADLCANGKARIWTMSASGEWVAGPTFPLETTWPQFDRFGDGRWLVVASRTGDESHARVLTSEGTVLYRVMLGDGIEHVAIDAHDRIWIGWFDEGIVGNYYWRMPGQEWPPSRNAVACFADDGNVLPLPRWPTEAGFVADCYALNATGSCAWVCPYPDFPLVRLVPGESSCWWRSDIAGPKAIAFDGDHAVVAGGYAKNANRLALVALIGNGEGEHASALASWELPLRRLPRSENTLASVWDDPDLLTGRDDTLHLVDDGVWYRWRVRDLTRL